MIIKPSWYYAIQSIINASRDRNKAQIKTKRDTQKIFWNLDLELRSKWTWWAGLGRVNRQYGAAECAGCDIEKNCTNFGVLRESNSRPLAPEARIIPLDQTPIALLSYIDNLYNLYISSGWFLCDECPTQGF